MNFVMSCDLYTGSCEQYLSMQLLDLERYVPLERCRLVRYDDYSETLDQSFEGQEVMGGGIEEREQY